MAERAGTAFSKSPVFTSGRVWNVNLFPKGRSRASGTWWMPMADTGRLSTRVARILSGKDNPRYTPFLDTGDHVVVINASKVKLTGLKANAKVIAVTTGFPGGLREEEFTKRPGAQTGADVQEAIEGMLPKSKLGRAMATKLKVYRDEKHPHQAQKPEAIAPVA